MGCLQDFGIARRDGESYDWSSGHNPGAYQQYANPVKPERKPALRFMEDSLPLAFILLLAALTGAGCQTSMQKTLFTASGLGWTVQEGQALWRAGPHYSELAGEIVMVRHKDGRCSIQFTKTPLPLVLAQTTGTNWLIQFPPQQMSFGGRGAPPRRFTWLYLPTALAGKPLPKNFSFQRKPDGGWRLENTHTGETLEGFLTP